MQPSFQAPVPTPHRNRRPLVIAALVGLLVGGGSVGAAWALDDGTSSRHGSAERDARGACDALATVDESKLGAKGKAGEQALYRFAAAFDLVTAAAAGDSSYDALADAITRAHQRHRQAFEVDTEVRKDLDKAREICAGL
ncbi:hypothetical protein [Streptomyces sp. NPDC017890]|uniref:hypothetical protein n=1 Tax=Streptomyces sp. NPDC017890 TaxID=3365015 RepID=UPI0037B4C9BD